MLRWESVITNSIIKNVPKLYRKYNTLVKTKKISEKVLTNVFKCDILKS